MTRYALISDIHANLPALEAVLTRIGGAVEAIYHLGDLVGYGPWPNETVGVLAGAGVVGVAGNYDSTTAFDYDHCGCRYEDPRQEAVSHTSFEWTKRALDDATRRRLATLPFRLDLRLLGGHRSGPTLILVHGTPTLNTVYWTEDRPPEFCLKMAQLAGAKSGDVLAFGHTHRPWHRVIEGIHFVNTGSVGRPKDGDWRAGYVELRVEPDGAIGIEFVRVEYDVDRTVTAIADRGLPNDLAEYLVTGGRLRGREGSREVRSGSGSGSALLDG